MSQASLEVMSKSMEQLKTMFRLEMDQMNERIENPTSPRPASTTAGLSADFTSFRNFVMGALQLLQDQLYVISCEVDNIEMRSRRKILLLDGVPEESKENCAEVVVRLVSQNLHLNNFSGNSISRCHRMGPRKGDKPRPLLFKLTDSTQRSKIWQAKTKLKGTGFTLSEFLTKSRHDAFISARQRFGVTKSWTQEGSVYVIGGDGARYRSNSQRELEKVPLPTHDAVAPKHTLTAVAAAVKAVKEPAATTLKTRRAVVAARK